MVRTQIKLTAKQAEEVKRIARARRVSTAEIIREALNNLIRSGTVATVTAEDRRARALNAVGRFSSGKRDITRKHDAYLAEAFRI